MQTNSIWIRMRNKIENDSDSFNLNTTRCVHIFEKNETFPKCRMQ